MLKVTELVEVELGLVPRGLDSMPLAFSLLHRSFSCQNRLLGKGEYCETFYEKACKMDSRRELQSPIALFANPGILNGTAVLVSQIFTERLSRARRCARLRVIAMKKDQAPELTF